MKRFIALAVSSLAIVIVLMDRFHVDIAKNLTNIGTVGITMGMLCVVGAFFGLHWATKK